MDKNALLIELSELGRFWSVTFDELTRPEQVFRAIWDLEAYVNNGGFDQYYWNSAGDTAFAVVDALNEIGADGAASIVTRAHQIFPEGVPPRDRAQRQDLLEQRPDRLEKNDILEPLDAAFYAYPDDLMELLFAYVRRNSEDIQGAAALLP